MFGGSSIIEKETKRRKKILCTIELKLLWIAFIYLFTCLLLRMNRARISMLLSKYIPAGRRNVDRTGSDGAETDSHEDRRNLDPLRTLSAYYYYYYY